MRRKWMTEVFQPLNDRAAEVITKNADLLEGSAMEPLLLQLVAHVFAYRVIIKRCDQPQLCGDPVRKFQMLTVAC